MSSMAECQEYLFKLQKYLPFLARTLDRLAALKDKAEWEKVKGLIQIISSDVHTIKQLRPDTLERCEGVCRTLYLRYGREDETNYRSSSNPGPSGSSRPGLADASSSRTRFEAATHRPQPSHNVDYDETPRSPSPEEDKHRSTSYVPKEIPDRRSDLDLRTAHQPDMARRDNPRSPSADVPPKHLRTEPVEIPTAPMLPRISSSEGFSKHDQDYRIPFNNRQPSHHKNFYEERRVHYKNDTGIRSTRVAGISDVIVNTESSSWPKRESRFDRYSALPTSVAPLFPQDDHPVSSNFSKRPNQWDIQSSRDRNVYNGERDRPDSRHPTASDSRNFSSRNHHGPLQTNSTGTPNLASYPKSTSRWTPPIEQTGPTQRNRVQDNAWEPKHVAHLSTSVRNGEVPYSRMDQVSNRFEQNHLAHQNASQSWSGHGSQPNSKSHFAPEKESSSGMGYRHPDQPVLPRRFPSPPLAPPMASSASASSSYPQPNRQVPAVPNYLPASQPPAGPPQPTVRREDPRLANRSTKPPQPPTSTNRPLATTSNPAISQSSRHNDPRDIQRPSPKPSVLSESTKDSHKELRRDTATETSSVQSSASTVKLDEGTGSNNPRSPNAFVSPLDSLYKSSSQSNQTGRGYGIQKSYRIPKRHSNELHSSKLNSKVIANDEANDASAGDGTGGADSTSTAVSEVKETNLTDDISNKHSKDDDNLARIPLDVVEGCLKRAMSPHQAAKLIEKIKTGNNGNDDELPSQIEGGRKSKNVTRDSGSESDPAYDRTVSSSGEALIIHTSEDEGPATAALKDTPSKTSDERAAVDSSNDQDQIVEPEQKKTRGRRPRANNGLPSELARLHEDLTDYMKGTVDAGGRRSRSRTSQQQVFDKVSEINDHDGDDEEMDATYTGSATTKQLQATAKGKRGRKRKMPPSLPKEVDLTQSDETPEQPPEKMEIDLDAHDSSSTTEPNSTLESTSQQVGMRGRKMTKKKQKPRSQKAIAVRGKDDPSPELDTTGKPKKRKKAFIPTRLSLRGRRSMYENSELNDALDDPSEVALATADEYFQCKECSYLGQKIIHHYVNEHNGKEIPYVSVPESEWTSLSNLGPAEDFSFHHPVNSDLLSDLSWIPTRSNLMTPTHCKLCPYSSCKRSELMEHIMLHAMPTNCKYRCNLCCHTESNFFDILDHVTGHTGEYRYHCNYCDFRVASRTGIKQHMSSLHESQDVLFYSTSLPDINQLWIYGFVCITCRFVQMDPNLLERHLTASTGCNNYLKVNLISTIHEDSSGAECSVAKKEDTALSKEKIGVFLCHTLTEEAAVSTSNKDVDDYISKTLRGQGSSKFIQNLAEKLTQGMSPRDVPEEVASSDTVTEKESRSEEPLLSQPKTSNETLTRFDAIGPRNSRLQRVTESTNDETNIPDPEAVDPNPEIRSLVWTNQNSWLETTISKLADKLGNSTSNPASPSTDHPDEESSFLDEEEDSYESDDSSYDEESGDSSLIETEENIADDSSNLDTNNEVCTEANPGPFLRIENVISLTTTDEGDCLDPIQSELLVSNVTIRKGEITFPFSIAHDRPAFASQLKEKQPYESMVHRDRIINLYKCMAHRCMFSSQSAKDFMHHLHWHNRQYLDPNLANSIPERQIIAKSAEGVNDSDETLSVSDFCLCSYCPASFEIPEKLVEHVHNVHGESTFQCSSCFFRARLSKTVAIHAIVAHNNDARTLDCQRATQDVPLQDIEPRQISILDIPRYVCNVPDCLFTCIHRSSFVAHMSMSHPGRRNCECRVCKRIITCSSSDCTELFLHMNKHGLGFFHCAFCQWGTDLPTDILLHLCLVHPSLPGKTLIRSSQNADSANSSKPLTKFWTPGLPNSYSRTHVIDLDGRFNELFVNVQVIESSLGPGDDIFDGSSTIESPSKVQPPIEPVSDFDKEARDENDHQLNESEQTEAQVFHGFGEEEKAKAKEKSSVCIVLGEEIEDSNSPFEQRAQNEDGQLFITVQEDEEEKQVGLSGRELYMCGNIGCDETAESVAAFKEHLLVCDLARDSRLLTCRHCGKNMKQISYLIEHLRVHGVKRFMCSLCSFRAVQLPVVRKHMKTVHRVNIADEVAIGPGPGPALPENTLFSLYPREMAAKLKSSRTRAGSNRSNRTFSCKEAATIPMKSILPYTVKCAHCGYTSKVRANMVRHLALHEMRIESANGTSSEGEEIIPRVVVPDQAPVNPVPHLESPAKGKMFDKMANLAYSSHATNGKMGSNKGGKMSGRTVDTNDDLTAAESGTTSSTIPHSLPPVFVPDHQRYVCGFDDCGHLTFNDNVLKHHMQTLHKKAVFSCPHCRAETASELSLDSFRNHLRIHGPKLYKCGHCDFYHWQLHEIENHLTEKHPNRTPWQIVIREPGDTEIKRLQNSGRSPEKNTGNRHKLPWHCCLCKHAAASIVDVSAHVDNVHGVKSQFKCALCPVRCNIRSEFDRHFVVKHPKQEVQVLSLFYRVESHEDDKHLESEVEELAATNIQPLWKKNEFRPRHIRGILLEENETKRFNPIPSTSEMASTSAKVGPKSTTNVTGASTEQQREPDADPVFGTYGFPVNGLLSCPMCTDYHVAYGRDLKNHLYRELNYNRFFCSICNEGASSRVQAQKHVEKQHPTSNAYFREITSNQELENWVEKVIVTQTTVLKATKSTLPNKAKRPLPSPVTSPMNSPIKLGAPGPKKGKKPVVTITVSDSPSSDYPKTSSSGVENVNIEPQKTESASSTQNATIYKCLACKFIGDSDILLRNHVVTAHGTEATSLCLQCGFKFTTQQSIIDHQKETNHNISLQPVPNANASKEFQQHSGTVAQDSDSTAKKVKEEKKKSLPYWCKHCNFRAQSEHGINLHWQSKHSAMNLPLDFGYDLPTGEVHIKPEAVKILYKCLYCGFQGQFEDVKEHSKSLHPNNSPKVSRVTSKVRHQVNNLNAFQSGSSSTLQPQTKKIRQDLEPKTSNPVTSPSSSGIQPIKTLKSTGAAGSVQTVFVVAPPIPPTHTCVCCFAKFHNETALIRHHASHPSNVPLRYTCLDISKTSNADPTSTTPPKPELAVMEIRFSCPVCSNKHFTSLTNAQTHVVEHKQAWKCCHCTMLFSSPEQALSHWKEVHPGLQGRLESIDSNQIVDKLTKEIKLIRIQLNMKNLLKSTQSADQSSKGTREASLEKSSDPTPTNPQPCVRNLTGTSARKSTSGNSFLKESAKKESLSSSIRIDSQHESPPGSSS